VLKDVEKLRPANTPSPPTPSNPERPAPPSTSAGATSLLSNTLTSSEIDGVRDKIAPCWLTPAGEAGDLSVDIKLEIAADGRVTHAEIPEANRARMATDPAYRAAAERALRAVQNPRCQPLPLPPEKYNEWHNSTFTFNPKD
jgi:hypothetical protein